MKNIIIILASLLSVVSCSSTPKKTDKNIQITVKHQRSDDSWKISYKLPSKVKALIFNRQTNTFRHNNWKVESEDLEIKLINEQEYVVSKTGKEFDSLLLSHNSYYKYTPKDYEFFFKYSDGDVLMYTGHYDVFPLFKKVDLKNGVKDWPENRPLTEYTLLRSSNEQIIIMGSVYDKNEVRWIDTKGKGTYIYWGSTKPLDTKRLIVVVDRKVPNWLSQAVNKNLPTLFEFYNKKTGVPLSFKPVVYLNYTGEEEEGLSNSGGTLPGLIQLTLRGKDWKKKNSESFEYLYKFLAHEAAHLWNGQMYSYPDGKHSWMHEGGADAFAYRAMKELNVVTHKKYLEYINASLNKCILGLDGSYPLVESAKNRAFKNYYFCGSTIGMITELSLKEGQLFDFWSSLFSDANSKGGKYTDKMYLEKYDELSKYTSLRNKLDTLIYGPITSTGNLLKSIFQELGVKTVPLGNGKENLAKRVAKNLLSQLYKNDCNGRLNLTRKKHYYLAHGMKECKTFKKDFKFHKVNKYNIFKQPQKAYEEARLSCNKKKYVNLKDTNSKELKVPCKKLSGPFIFFELVITEFQEVVFK